MFCKICNKPCAPQFDHCYEHRKKREKKKIKRNKEVSTVKILTIQKLFNTEYKRNSYWIRVFGWGFIFRPWVIGMKMYLRKHHMPTEKEANEQTLDLFKDKK